MVKHILVPYDGPEPANHALEFALELAKLWLTKLPIQQKSSIRQKC